MRQKIIQAAVCAALIVCAGPGSPVGIVISAPVKKILMKDIPADGTSIHYLGKKYSAAQFDKFKSQEAAGLKQRLLKQFNLNFRVTQTKYFNIACQGRAVPADTIKKYLVIFFEQVYPRYFIYEPSGPIGVVYFADKKTFTKHTGNDSYGEYRYEDRTLYTYAGSGYGTLWHEMIHAFVDANMSSDAPQWFNEGLASFYEMGALVKDRHVEGYANWRLPILLAAVKNKKILPLEKFLQQDRFDDTSIGYAQARFFFCWLWTRGDMVPFVRYYLYEISPKYKGAEAKIKSIEKIEKLTGKKIDLIDGDYVKFVKSLSVNQKLKQRKQNE